jgi:hypothetical protein
MFRLGLTWVVPQDDKYPTRWGSQLTSFLRQPTDDWQSAWRLTEALILKTREVATAGAADFLLVELASPLAVMPEQLRLEHVPQTATHQYDFDGPHRRLTAIAQHHGLHFFSLQPAFRNRIGQSQEAFDSLFLDCDGHYTVDGHRLAADALSGHLAVFARSSSSISERLRRSIWTDRQPSQRAADVEAPPRFEPGLEVLQSHPRFPPAR